MSVRKKTILWISLRAPYDTVTHAGGKVHNYYIKKFQESGLFDISLLTFCRESEVDKIDLERYDINYEAVIIKQNELSRKILGKIGFPPSLFEYCFVRKNVKKRTLALKKQNTHPDYIFLHWTEIVMMYRFIKKIFPDSKIICIEEDVTFLKLQRKVEHNKGIKKIIFLLQEKMIKKQELLSLRNADLCVLNNQKDRTLVIENGIPKEQTFVTAPFFNNLESIERHPDGKTLIFWGAMNRPENEEAAIWFIENVMPSLKDIQFVIIGANPTERIKKYTCENIIVTGFVDNPGVYFEKCLCMVVPLKNGAGIKIKVLEGMSAGIPVLTNTIGIEGIPAEDKRDYYYCETGKQYIEAISHLQNNVENCHMIGNNAKMLIKQAFNFEETVGNFITKVSEMNE